MSTPLQDGFYMPPEWASHLRSWMMWPCRAEVWDDMDATRANYAQVAHAIRQFEPVTMVVQPDDAAQAADLLGADIDLMSADIDDSWCRDAGPCFVKSDAGARAGVSFEFNAWGGKYSPYAADNAVAQAILDAAGVPAYGSSLIAEGGGISVDGEGTLLTTLSCFPNANRNPDWSVARIEEELKQMLGVQKVIWLPGNPAETETDGHVDGIAAFVAPGVVLMEGPGSAGHPYTACNQANLNAMQGQTDATGRDIKIITMPFSESIEARNDLFCDTYINSYIVNGGIIMPGYGVREDGIVREIYQDLFPDREVVMVDIAAIATGGGGIHCITQQEPG